MNLIGMMKVKKQPGFTIVELLIVIVVIGILAAITIVAYNGVQGRAHDTIVQSDLSNLAKKFQLFYADNGRYPNVVADLDSLEARVDHSAYLQDSSAIQSNLVACHTGDSQAYSITAISVSGKRFYVTGGHVQEYTGATSWGGTGNYSAMCSSTLSGSVATGSGSGWTAGTWRPWTGS